MTALQNHTQKQPLVYVTRDIERALGMEPKDGYFIITNTSPYGVELQRKYPDNIWLIDGARLHGGLKLNRPLDTHELLMVPEVARAITTHAMPIIVFKNTHRIEKICAEKKWKLLNPSAEVAEKVENKILQVEWLGELSRFLPPHAISLTKNIRWSGTPFVLQWAHSHTGEGTMLVASVSELDILQAKFPNREARISAFVEGSAFTSNIVVASDQILTGNINFQITGLAPFTDNPFSTVGNDWALPHTMLSAAALTRFNEMVYEVGKKMHQSGWKGLFGIDTIYHSASDAWYLIEINARQPASSAFESQLQAKIRAERANFTTTFENHVSALIGLHYENPIPLSDGAQIVQRVTDTISMPDIRPKADTLRRAGFTVIEYSNTKHNADLLRIQSDSGIMETPSTFTTRGSVILHLLEKTRE